MSYDFSSAVNAVKTIRAFPAQISTASSSLNGISLGPWSMSIHCSYGACNKGKVDYDSVVDFSEGRTLLQQALGNINTHSQTFLAQLEDELDLLKVLSGNVITKLNAIKTFANDAAWKNKDSIISILNIVANDTGEKVQSLTTENQTIAQYASDLDKETKDLAAQSSSLKAQIDARLSSIQNQVNGFACGGDQASRQLDNFRSFFFGAYNNISTVIGNLATRSFEAENAMNVMIGTFSVFIVQWNAGTKDMLKAADQAAFNTAMANMDISIAVAQWTALHDELAQLKP